MTNDLPKDCPALVVFRLPTGVTITRLPLHPDKLKGGMSRKQVPAYATAFNVPPSRTWHPIGELPASWEFTHGPLEPVWDEEEEAEWRRRHGLA